MDVREKVVSVLVDEMDLRREDCKDEASLVDDLCLDDLDIVEVVMHVESSLVAELTDDDMDGVVTVGDLVRVVEGKVGASAPA